MLELLIPEQELYDEEKQEFRYVASQTIQLEHSLISLSKWESVWKIPFLKKEDKTTEQVRHYIQCMTITQNVKDEVYSRLTSKEFKVIENYIQDTMTATWFTEEPGPGRSREAVTSELIYYWMIAYGIPVEFQKWHLNRLLTLIRICNIKNTTPKKMSNKDMLAHRKSHNAARRARLNSRG